MPFLLFLIFLQPFAPVTVQTKAHTAMQPCNHATIHYHEDEIIAYVRNPKGKQPDSGVPAYKLSAAASVYQKLLDARGDFRLPAPELVMNDGQLYVAWMNSKKQQVGIEEKAYDICASFGADSLNALAALLAHELTHYYEKHDWTRHFSRNNANTRAGEQLAELDEGLKMEVQSDYLGGFLALSAGFDTYGIIPQLLPRVYEGYVLPEEIPGYPSLADRIAYANNAMGRLQELQLAFGVANCLTVVEGYEPALDYYNYILRDFQSRELYNNLGVLHVLAALPFFTREEMPYILPLELDMESRLRPDKKGFEENAEKRAALLAAALDAFGRAELLDQEYPAAWINKACVFLLQGAPDDARYWAGKARKLSEKLALGVETRYAQVLQGIIAAAEGDNEAARALLRPLAEGGSLVARLNLSILEGVAPAEPEPLNFAKGVERIEGLLLDDYLENPEPELQVEMGGNVFCGLQRLEHSKILVHYAEDGKQYAVFHLAGDSYDGATRLGIRRGAGMEEVREKYASYSRVVGSRQGAYLVFPKENLFFRFDEQGKVSHWAIFRIQLEEGG